MPAVVAKLRAKAQADHRARTTMDRLDAEHRAVFVRAINNVLATEEALFTYAQIIDGLPIADVAWDRRSPGIFGDHPIEEHEELCPGALEKAREVCRQWDPAILSFDAKVINAFQHAVPGTKMFNTRLIELVAVALHQFGVLLHQLEFRMHKGDIDSITNWTMPKPDYEDDDDWEPSKPLPTIFNHPFYVSSEIYPEGVADMVGYWAEDRILGGVVVFDRRVELGPDGNLTGEPPNVYLHPSRAELTFRVTQLLDGQQQALVDFLLSKPDSNMTAVVPYSLPILVDDRNRTRVSPEEAVLPRGVYRDIWERRPLDRNEYNMQRRRPQSEVDYPEQSINALLINTRCGDELPEGEWKRYLDGEETLPEGPTKRMLDEYMDRFGDEYRARSGPGGKKQKLDGEDTEEGKGKERGGEKEEKLKPIKVDTVESLERFLAGKEDEGGEETEMSKGQEKTP
ncbi:hypothetical protein OQA88_5193 [Cercophora sp. LCS_1]